MIRRLLTGLVFMLFVGTASAQYRVDRLITAGRSALYYEDYVLSIKYFNLAIGAKPYLYEPWYYRSVAKFNLDDFVGAEGDANEALKLNPYINDIYDLRAITRIHVKYLDEEMQEHDEWVEGYLARVMQHEFDHLEGTMFIDRLSPLRKNMIAGKLKNILKGKFRCSYRTKIRH